MLPFTSEAGAERPVLKFLITEARLHAISEARDGDLRLRRGRLLHPSGTGPGQGRGARAEPLPGGP